jgi:cobalt-zinc-cadmium efflux system protein
MAHYRKPLAAAALLNTAIFVGEAVAGLRSGSLSLLMDGVHNLSDEAALVFLYLAFVSREGLSRHLLRSANLFNSAGLVLVSALLLWQALERVAHPAPVAATVPIVVGLAAAAGNWGVARLLEGPGRENPAIRLAYLHNVGDVYVSLAPVAAGVLVLATGFTFFDPAIGGIVALWLIATTLAEVIRSRDELISPRKIRCGHPE